MARLQAARLAQETARQTCQAAGDAGGNAPRAPLLACGREQPLVEVKGRQLESF